MASAQEFERLLAYVGARIQTFSGEPMRVALACAAVAGIALPAVFFGLLRISAFGRINPPNFIKVVTATLLCLSCYLAASLLVIWLKSLGRAVPSWVLIAVTGSVILVVVGGIWMRPAILRLPLAEIASDKLPDALGTMVGLSVFTLPFTAVVYYAGSIVRAIGRWHNGDGRRVSILGGGRSQQRHPPTACTRPATRMSSCTFGGLGGRAMPGVMRRGGPES